MLDCAVRVWIEFEITDANERIRGEEKVGDTSLYNETKEERIVDRKERSQREREMMETHARGGANSLGNHGTHVSSSGFTY